jgi:hypothetical protein
MLLSHGATTAPSVPEMQLELLYALSFDLSEGILNFEAKVPQMI